MEYIVVCLVALLASGLTFFSGFGLGTILMPVLAIFFPVPIAVAATALAHFANNLFKLFLVGRRANKSIVIQFGVPAIFAAVLGAFFLTSASSIPAMASYQIGGHTCEITTVKLVVGLLIVFFSGLEFVPAFAKISIDPKYLPIGGIISGFFGGLSGNQGAFRSMFLIKAGLAKEEFIGTNVVLAVIVDCGRLTVYGIGLSSVLSTTMANLGGLILAATISAFAGAYLGKMILKTVTLRAIQVIVGVTLILLGIALSIGIL
ncbi:MAG: TSUP family transporter [Candidatus Omnitrophota bacterium]